MGAPVQVGDLLADKYEVTRVLGQGGMGVVVAARHRELDKLVALKFMHEEVAANATATDRFLREARAAARLQSEHVGRVLDVGRMQNGVPYIVMEFLEGRDLSDVAADAGGSLPVSDVCEYMLQTCEAMAEAHAQGIVHRDLKPQNLFLAMRPDGRPLVKVLDFGISKVQSSSGPTATQQTMGTPAYMAPEQMRSAKNADARADIWSLGVILYQLLSGTLPFAGESIAETMLKVMTDTPQPIAAFRPGLPPALVAAIDKCLQKNRDDRFENVAELAHELVPFAPERARAAMSLIERVMSAGMSQPARAVVEDDLASVVPSAATVAPKNITESPASSTPRKVAAPQTTLGSAASAMSFEPSSKPSAAKWIAMSVVAVAAAVVITVFATRGGGGGTTAASSPDAAVIAPPDSAVVAEPPPKEPPKPETPATGSGAGSGSALIAREAPASGSGSGSGTPTKSVGRTPPPKKPATGSGSAAAAGGGSALTTNTGSGSQSATGSQQPAGSGSSGSATPKERKPVGDDQNPIKPRKPVGT